jgi:hypothetical protein
VEVFADTPLTCVLIILMALLVPAFFGSPPNPLEGKAEARVI